MNKAERWHNETLIGRNSTNLRYWGQYDRLIEFTIDNYTERKETIAAPLLHLIGHSLELGYKENIRYLNIYSGEELKAKIYHNHNLKELHEEFEKHVRKISLNLNVGKVIMDQFDSLSSISKQLLEILRIETPTYRYANKLDGRGNVVVKAIEDTYSINILDIIELYDDAIKMLTHTVDVLGDYTDYLDFKKDFPNFLNGKGYLMMHKQNISSKASLFTMMGKYYTKIGQDLWYDSEDDEYVQAFEKGRSLYFVPLREKPINLS